MNGKSGTQEMTDIQQGIWATGQFQKTLDKSGCVRIEGADPGFGEASYHIYLGLRVGDSGPVQYGPLDDLLGEDYLFYAKISQTGSFDIHLEAPHRSNQDVTIVWWASSLGRTKDWDLLGIGPTGGPTPPPPPPSAPPIGLMVVRFNPSDFPGRYVDEVSGLDAAAIQRLTEAGMKSLAALASADVMDVAQTLDISEVRAMSFIYEARLLLQEKSQQ